MAKLEIEFNDGTIKTFRIDECGDQGGMFSWRGDAAQAKRYGYVAVKNGVAITLNGEASPDDDTYPLASIRRMTERKD